MTQAGQGVLSTVGHTPLGREGSYAPMLVQLAGILLLLVGGFTLRYVVLLAGIHDPLVAPSIEAILNGMTFIP